MNFIEGGYIYINKPYRMTSFGALAHIRYVVSKRLHVKRVKMGHAGTLDPLATGVLVLCTGKATKQIEKLQLHTSWRMESDTISFHYLLQKLSSVQEHRPSCRRIRIVVALQRIFLI